MTTLPCLPGIIPQIQVTLRCNHDCAYCYQQHRGRIIPISTVASILEKAVAFNAGKNPFKTTGTIPIYWHGGEPLLAGIDFFEHVVALQSRFSGIHFDNRIQTNGTLMTEAFARFFVRHRFDVGFSLDGPDALHNHHRKYASAGSSRRPFADVLAGIERYRTVAGTDKVAVICVITKESTHYAKEIFHFFKELRARVQLDIYDVRAMDFSTGKSGSAPLFEIAPTVDKLAHFLITLFDLWFYDDSGQVDFKELRDEVKMVLQPEMDQGDPYDKRRCDIRRTIVDPEGNIFSCDQYINDRQTALGHIETDTLEQIIASKINLWETIKQHVRHDCNRMGCSICRWGRKCNGGCMTCMKYNSRLARVRKRGMADTEWVAVPEASGLADITGEVYYCDALRSLRDHVEASIS